MSCPVSLDITVQLGLRCVLPLSVGFTLTLPPPGDDRLPPSLQTLFLGGLEWNGFPSAADLHNCTGMHDLM